MNEANSASLEALCKAELASFKKPKRYIFCAELPKNSYGKVLKTELRTMVDGDGRSAKPA